MARILPPLILFIISLQMSVNGQGKRLWKYESGGVIYSTPAIDGDKIFIGSGDQYFYALRKKDGTEIWKFRTEGAVHSTAFVDRKAVYFASRDGYLYSVNKVNGSLIWKFKSGGERSYGLWDYYLSSPMVIDSTIFWGSGDGNIYALEAQTGEIIWKYTTGDIVHATPVVKGKKVFIGSFDGFFYCLNSENGQLKWKFNTIGAAYFPRGEIQKACMVDQDAVYFGSRDYNIYALDLNTGRGRWNMREPSGWIIATPVEYKDRLYFGTSDAHLFYSINKNNGRVIWKVPVSMRVYGKAAVNEDVVYFGTFDGKVIGVDYLTGEKVWEFQTENSKENYPQVYNKKGEFREGFELYGADTEETENKILSLGSILSDIVIENGILYFGSADGSIYAVRIKR